MCRCVEPFVGLSPQQVGCRDCKRGTTSPVWGRLRCGCVMSQLLPMYVFVRPCALLAVVLLTEAAAAAAAVFGCVHGLPSGFLRSCRFYYQFDFVSQFAQACVTGTQRLCNSYLCRKAWLMLADGCLCVVICQTDKLSRSCHMLLLGLGL